MSSALFTTFSRVSGNRTLPPPITSAEPARSLATVRSSCRRIHGSTVHGAGLPVSEPIVVAFTALLASIVAAGQPPARLVMMVNVIQALGLPAMLRGIILAVDRLFDISSTTVNVGSDCCGCAVIDY